MTARAPAHSPPLPSSPRARRKLTNHRARRVRHHATRRRPPAPRASIVLLQSPSARSERRSLSPAASEASSADSLCSGASVTSVLQQIDVLERRYAQALLGLGACGPS